ncbi:hypothetical protein E4U59_005407 [Claviceps monticola]|nr:hypothetical protein E4U59_005407 [Claviceps monticola]
MAGLRSGHNHHRPTPPTPASDNIQEQSTDYAALELIIPVGVVGSSLPPHRLPTRSGLEYAGKRCTVTVGAWRLSAQEWTGTPTVAVLGPTRVTPSVGNATQTLQETVSDSSSDDDEDLEQVVPEWVADTRRDTFIQKKRPQPRTEYRAHSLVRMSASRRVSATHSSTSRFKSSSSSLEESNAVPWGLWVTLPTEGMEF